LEFPFFSSLPFEILTYLPSLFLRMSARTKGPSRIFYCDVRCRSSLFELTLPAFCSCLYFMFFLSKYLDLSLPCTHPPQPSGNGQKGFQTHFLRFAMVSGVFPQSRTQFSSFLGLLSVLLRRPSFFPPFLSFCFFFPLL